jgi:simple sugar transport system substrate-binding protein
MKRGQNGYAAQTFDIFTGPIYDTGGTLRVKDGEIMPLADLAVMDWFVKGVESAA